jgi:hypothetical protein
MPAKMFPHLKLLCLWAPLLVLTQSKETVKFGVFYNKSKILTILFIVNYEKKTLFNEFLVLLGSIISSFLACSKSKQKQQRVLALVLSLWMKCLCLQVIKEDTRISYECLKAKKHRYMLTLTIKNPSLSDAGMYRCNAFNPFGDSNANIDLNFESEWRQFRERACTAFSEGAVKIMAVNITTLSISHSSLRYSALRHLALRFLEE